MNKLKITKYTPDTKSPTFITLQMLDDDGQATSGLLQFTAHDWNKVTHLTSVLRDFAGFETIIEISSD